MPRRSSNKSLNAAVTLLRMAARSERKRQKLERARFRSIEKEEKEAMRQDALQDKEAKLRYIESRIKKTGKLNRNLTNTISDLRSILQQALNTDSIVSFEKLRINEEFSKFALPTELEKEPIFTSREEYFSKISKPSVFGKLIPGWEKRYEKTLQKAENLFKDYENEFNAQIIERNSKITVLREEYENDKRNFELKIQQRNQEVDEFEETYKRGDPAAVSIYCSMVLERSEYSDGFPQEFRIAYVPKPKELVVEYELPIKDIVPTIAEYRYIKTRDTIEEKLRKLSDIKELYQDVVVALCLRTLHELFTADQGNHLDVVVFNGFVQTADPATGKDVRPYLISIRTIKEKFNEINLAKVDKRVCLRNLGAQVSPQPDELMAVKPVVNFDMVDKRFVNESDVISELDTKPNLMDLNPFEFENFVHNLFSKIGFEAKLTRSSRDGGIDVVAFDPRPILGGKVVIQVKRYKNVVGVSAVRDLYGSMINEGASKGLLVTTSHYGTDAYNFAKDKPIELIDGGGLLYLLEQNDIKAKIIFPQE